nr:collagen-like protein [Paenibacillus herberti]
MSFLFPSGPQGGPPGGFPGGPPGGFPGGPPGGFPGGPPGGFPGGPPGGPPGGFPGGVPGGPGGGPQPPSSPPPQTIPAKPFGVFAVDPGAIAGCAFRYTYIWPRNGAGFWFYPVFIGRTSISGFRWNGFFWMFSGLDLQRIESFTCF